MLNAPSRPRNAMARRYNFNIQLISEVEVWMMNMTELIVILNNGLPRTKASPSKTQTPWESLA